jgi:CDP-4-dehydro-6-deoxyglucose reductase
MTDKVELVNDSRSFSTETGENILGAALRQGIVIPHNCRNGFCGSCIGLLHNGDVEYEGDERPRALSEEKEKEGFVVCCQAKTKGDILLEVETIDAVADTEIKTLPCRVSRLVKLADDVMLMMLKLPPHEKFQFHAGQYLDILLRDGRRRSFSMASSPSSELIELHIRKVPDGSFTGEVFNEMKEKDMLRIQGPFGTFILRDDNSRPAILIAGGTGLAPLKSMLEKIREEGCDRTLHLYWGVRGVRDLYFHKELNQWTKELDCLTYTPVLSEPDSTEGWSGATGWVHEAVLADFPDLQGFDVYASGPPPMINAIQNTFAGKGLQQGHFYFDSFEYANDGV